MAHGKELICLSKTAALAGVEHTVLTDSQLFAEADISEIHIDDPWWGIVDLTVQDYVALTYAAYTVNAPPAAGVIMFNADRTAFKCGNPLWWGASNAYIIAVGSRVLVS